METKIIYGAAVGNALLDCLLILPNAYVWQHSHEWISVAAMAIIGALGVGGLIAARVAVRWIQRG